MGGEGSYPTILGKLSHDTIREGPPLAMTSHPPPGRISHEKPARKKGPSNFSCVLPPGRVAVPLHHGVRAIVYRMKGFLVIERVEWGGGGGSGY